MKRTVLTLSCLFFIAAIASAQFGKKKNYDAGSMSGEVREVPDFEGISVRSGVDVYIHQANERSVEVKSEDIALEKIITEVRGDVLYVEIKKNKSWGWNWGNNKAPRIDVWIDDLESIHASGGSDVYSDGTFRTDEISLKSSGGSDLYLDLDAGKLTATSSGGSDLHLSGQVHEMDLHSSGGSDIKAYKLTAKRCEVSSSGGSDAYVNVSEEISIQASGASDIHVKGSAKVLSKSSTGSSDIHMN